MASTDHTVRLATRTYERLEAEAQRRHRAVDEVADELLGERLPDLPLTWGGLARHSISWRG